MRTDERGETLLEMVIAVAIMGIVLVAFAGGLIAVTLISDIHRKQASAGAYVRDYAEAIEAWVAGGNYPACSNTAAYDVVAVPSFPASGYTKRVSAASCPNAYGAGSLLQQLTLEVAATDGRATERLVIVIRKPCSVSPC